MSAGNGVKPQFLEDEGGVKIQVGDDGHVVVVEEWGEEVLLPGSIEKVAPGEVVAVFPAYVKQAKIMIRGELQITLGIPFAAKYTALAVTDQIGVMFEVEVRKPPKSKGGRELVEEKEFDPWILV